MTLKHKFRARKIMFREWFGVNRMDVYLVNVVYTRSFPTQRVIMIHGGATSLVRLHNRLDRKVRGKVVKMWLVTSLWRKATITYGSRVVTDFVIFNEEGGSSLEIVSTILIDGFVLLCSKEYTKCYVLQQVCEGYGLFDGHVLGRWHGLSPSSEHRSLWISNSYQTSKSSLYRSIRKF